MLKNLEFHIPWSAQQGKPQFPRICRSIWRWCSIQLRCLSSLDRIPRRHLFQKALTNMQYCTEPRSLNETMKCVFIQTAVSLHLVQRQSLHLKMELLSTAASKMTTSRPTSKKPTLLQFPRIWLPPDCKSALTDTIHVSEWRNGYRDEEMRLLQGLRTHQSSFFGRSCDHLYIGTEKPQ